MKTLKLFLFSSLLVLNSSLLYGQNWLWGGAGYCSLKAQTAGTPVATDKQGNAYITGKYSTSISFGSHTLRYEGDIAYLVKYNSTGIVQWALQPNPIGDSYSIGSAVATDPKGNIILTGQYSGEIIFGNDTLNSGSISTFNMFLVKYDSNGNVMWAKQPSIYSYSSPYSNSLGCDNLGNSYVTGHFSDAIIFGVDTLRGTFYNFFLTKYDQNGNVIWAEQSTTSSGESIGESVITYNNAQTKYEYVTGNFSGIVSFGVNTLEASSNNVFLIKYDTTGNVLWAKQSVEHVGTSNSCNSMAITTDPLGNAYGGGSFIDTLEFDTNIIIGPIGLYSSFLVKYNPLGNVLWNKKSVDGSWQGISLASDNYNHIYYSGKGKNDSLKWYGSTLTTINTYADTGQTSFILKLDTAGNLLCGSLHSSGGRDYVGTACDSTGKYIYQAGNFVNDTLYCGPDTLFNDTIDGGNSSYVTRWLPCDEVEGISEISNPTNTILLYPNPNTGKFTIQLSGGNSNSEIEIYNILGEKVFIQTLNNNDGDNSVSIGVQPSGIYLYRIINESGKLIGGGKFIVE